MSDEEKIIVLSSIYAVTEQNMEASAVLEQEYADFIGKNNESVNLFNVIFLNKSLDRAYAGGTGYYFNGGTAYLNIDREKKIRSISVSWRKHDNGMNNSNNSYSFIQGTLYIDGLYQGSKTIRDFSYDTFYLFGKQAKFSAQLRISGGDVYISSVYVDYE